MNFEIISEITEIETIAIEKKIRDKGCAKCMAEEDGGS